MRVLGIETSSRRGSVALVEDGREVAVRIHEEPGAHAERSLSLVLGVMADAGWEKRALDRIAVGVGPGSFTGLRVGLALAQGMGLGLGRPVVGVSSLLAMSHGAPGEVPGPRCVVVDARRSELFVAVFGPDAQELEAPRVIPAQGLGTFLASLPVAPTVVLGEAVERSGAFPGVFRSALTDLPHATSVARIAAERRVEGFPAEPAYVREADARRPNLPRSPLSSRETR